MLYSKQLAVLLIGCVAIFSQGCDRQSPTETLATCFEEMKSASLAYNETLAKITDGASAKANLPELKERHERLGKSFHALSEAEKTSSRATMNIKREIEDFKREQKVILEAEFGRLEADVAVNAIVAPFLR